MRREPTEPERRVWNELRNSGFFGHKFRRQATIGNRIADFFCPGKGLIVEIDGDTHDRDADLKRDAMVECQTGFRTIRFTNREVMHNIDGVLSALKSALNEKPDRWGGGG
ncbi:endonuclease domain-containing protein [Sphingorhabdus soli]|uniref:Endonuclease domain-containing protein n=2 Tax=Flavisphingopyxis soli TaxID=2601267 RepID=A0A5C6U7R3_9SPHN|nr:endonuclease domain-containing protein [Sphingorhabdus soli]